MSVRADSAGADDPRLASRVRLTLAVCALAALVEGFDIQAMGVAGPRIIREFALTPAVAGWLFSGGTLGQALGSLLGGRLGDRIGRRGALFASLLLIGLCSLGTVASAHSSELFATRILAGIGLGGALPNFITIASESLAPERRQRLVTLLMAGLPTGALLASLTSLGNGVGWGWRTIFVVGSVVALTAALLSLRIARAPAAGGALHDTAAPAPRSAARLAQVLFGAGRAPATLFLWVSFFFTQLILLLMVTWLPSLAVRSGFSDLQATSAQICFNVSGIFGSYVVGRLQSGARRRLGVTTTYLAIGAALALAGIGRHLYPLVLLAAAGAGVFISGAQLALYALAPLYYARAIRASGVGGAATAGRLGSVAGPLFAGLLLAGGGNPTTVLLGIEPFVVIGGAAALALCWCTQSRD